MSEQTAPADREIVYVADPMCSWCWGFSPAIGAIAETFGDQVTITPIMGGLRPLTRDAMDDSSKASIRDHWTHVTERTGQPFDFSFFERDGFVYDTEPACRAVVTVRAVKPSAALSFLARVHRAFYAEGADVTDADVLAGLAEEVGVPRDDFESVFPTRAAIYQTSGDFHTAHRLGATGFPTILLRDGQQMQMLSAGYQPFKDLKPKIEAWLQAADAA